MPQDAYDELQPRVVILGNSTAALALAERFFREFGTRPTILFDRRHSLPRTPAAHYRCLPSLSHTGILRQELGRLAAEELEIQPLLFLGRGDCAAALQEALTGAEDRYLCLFGRRKKERELPPAGGRRRQICGFGDGSRVWLFTGDDSPENRKAAMQCGAVGCFSLSLGGGRPTVFSPVIPVRVCYRDTLPILELPLRHLILCENQNETPPAET